jgi:plastocyanin
MRSIGVSGVAIVLLMVVTVAHAGATTRMVSILGSDSFVANALVMSTFRFEPGPLEVETGATVTWSNATDEPHTVSIVSPSILPTSFDAIFACQTPPSGACVPFLVNPNQNVGVSGLDQVGDSILVPAGQSVSASISAPPGSTLSYLCAFHPWMQGSLRVK